MRSAKGWSASESARSYDSGVKPKGRTKATNDRRSAGTAPSGSRAPSRPPIGAGNHTHGPECRPGCGHAHEHASPRGTPSPTVRGVERDTRQRRAIREEIERADRPLTPAEIHVGARSSVEGLGLATVYRTLRILADEGVITEVQVPGEAPRYEMADKAHHHHFYCRQCERVFEVEGCPGDLAALTPAGFELDGHELLLFGTCAGCRAGSGR